MWCIQYSKKLNGGNQALKAIYFKIYQHEKKELYLKEDPWRTIFFIFFQHRNVPTIVSDPICSILLTLAKRKKVLHFVQSDDFLLFQKYGFFINFIYKKIYMLIKFNKSWLRFYNSNYTHTCFKKRFEIDDNKSMIVPMLGINKLFPKKFFEQKKPKSTFKFIWIGSKHSFKGGKIFIKAIKASKASGHMIFSGGIPRWALGHAMISIENNLKKETIFKSIQKFSALIYTSSFDSFALPLFEALLMDCPVIAIKNKCIELNQSYKYVTVVDNVYELIDKMSNLSELDKNKKVKINWKLQQKRFDQWLKIFNQKLSIKWES